MPTIKPPINAPSMEPSTIININDLWEYTTLKELSFLYLINPVIIVGRLIARLKLPANFMSIPKRSINVGIMSSQPATPKTAAKSPIINPEIIPRINII